MTPNNTNPKSAVNTNGKLELFISAIALLSLILSANAWAADKSAEAKKEAPKTDTGEVDITDIQSQYWKTHDKEFEVIQNRAYSKAKKFEFTPLFGMYQRVSFQDTKTVGGALAFHFSETMGIEVMAHKMFNEDSSVLKRFKDTRGANIEFNEEKYYVGGSFLFEPIYGKFSFFGKKISHFDLYLSPNLGVTKTNAIRFTYGVGLGQKFWISSHFNVRVEYRWTHYQDQTDTNEGITAKRNGGPGYFEDAVNDQNLLLGISFLI